MHAILSGVCQPVRDFVDSIFEAHEGQPGLSTRHLLRCFDPENHADEELLEIKPTAARAHPEGELTLAGDDELDVLVPSVGWLRLPGHCTAHYKLVPSGDFCAVRLGFPAELAPLLDSVEGIAAVTVIILCPKQIEIDYAGGILRLTLEA